MGGLFFFSRRVRGRVTSTIAGPLLPLLMGGALVAGAAVTMSGLPPLAIPARAAAALPGLLPNIATPDFPAEAIPDAGGPAPVPERARRLPLLGMWSGGGAAPAPGPRWSLSVPAVGLQVSVIDYGDCSGDTAMTRVAAVHYLCTPGNVTTLIGHNPGVFSPLLRTHAGDVVSYTAGGATRDYVIGSPVRVSPSTAAQYTQDGSFTHMVLTTCAEPDSSAYWVFIARPAGPVPQGVTPASSGSGGPAPSPSPSPSPSPRGPLHGLVPPPPG